MHANAPTATNSENQSRTLEHRKHSIISNQLSKQQEFHQAMQAATQHSRDIKGVALAAKNRQVSPGVFMTTKKSR